MKINNRTISPISPTLVIAEIGVNHDGDVARAIELVRAAKAAGADAIKLQVFKAEHLMHPSARFAEYQVGRVDAEDPVAMLRQYELTDAELAAIKSAADAEGLLTIATPFSPSDVARVVAMGAHAIKIASPDLVNRVLLAEAAATGLPMIVSTGAATLNEIDAAVDWLSPRCDSLCLLHCVSSYPTAVDDAQLCWIGELRQRYAVAIGYSDHTTELFAGALAVAAGACVLEKHLTYDTAARGPDHSASASPATFKQYVTAVRAADTMRGRGTRRVLPCEEEVRQVSRQNLVLARPLRRGDVLSAADLTTQRARHGISAVHAESVVGNRLILDVAAGEILLPTMIGEQRNVA